jgi:hypothetical protein
MHRNWKYGECENIFQIFGPVLPIIPVKNEDEAIEYIQNGWVCFLWYFVVDKNLCKRSELVSDCWLMPNEIFFSYIMARTSYIWKGNGNGV